MLSPLGRKEHCPLATFDIGILGVLELNISLHFFVPLKLDSDT